MFSMMEQVPKRIRRVENASSAFQISTPRIVQSDGRLPNRGDHCDDANPNARPISMQIGETREPPGAYPLRSSTAAAAECQIIA
jgi:hypothetical protein